MYSFCSFKLLSAWMTVAITVERVIAVVQPHKVATWSTTGRVRLVIVLLTLICFVLGAFPLWTIGSVLYSGVPLCIVIPEKQSTYGSWLIAVVVLMTLALPYCLLVLCTTVIIVFLARSQRFRRNVSRSRTLLWSPYVTGQTIYIFMLLFVLLLLFFLA